MAILFNKTYYINGIVSFLLLYITIYYLDVKTTSMKRKNDENITNHAITINHKILNIKKDYNSYAANERANMQRKLDDEIYIIKYRTNKIITYLIQRKAMIHINTNVAMKKIEVINNNLLKIKSNNDQNNHITTKLSVTT